jgi:plastocyanin
MRRTLLFGTAAVVGAVALMIPLPAPTEAAPVPKVKDKSSAAMKKLTALFPPRETPIQPGTEVEWAAVEKDMQITFPKEYKEFVQTYGYMVVNDFMGFKTPFAGSLTHNLATNLAFHKKHAGKREVIWPTEGGILPIASTVCADHLCYRCKGEPDEWTVVIITREGEVQCEYPFGLIEFMTRMADGTLDLGEMRVHKEMHPPLTFK